MTARRFKSERHNALAYEFPPDAPDVRLSHGAVMRASPRPPALNPLQRLAHGVANVFNRNR